MARIYIAPKLSSSWRTVKKVGLLHILREFLSECAHVQ